MKLKHLLLTLLLPIFSYGQTVVDIVVNSPDHEILETAVLEAGLDVTLSGEGPFTLFAPTDDAFNALPDGVIEDLLINPEGELSQILLYHTLGLAVQSTELTDGIEVATINGAEILVTIGSNNTVLINGVLVTTADIPATNGIVHVINAVLLPNPTSVVDAVIKSPDHNILQTEVTAAGLGSTLDGEGPFTLFAPTDAAFGLLQDGTIDALLADPNGALTDVLLNHVIGDDLTSDFLFDDEILQALNKKGIVVSVSQTGEVQVNGINVSVADITTPNGVVHVIDAVIVPNFSIMDIIEDSEVHNTLEAAIDAVELTPILHTNEVELTVFAPTDAAFEALPDGVLETLLADPQGQLSEILLFHLSGGATLAADLSDGVKVSMVNGKQADIVIDGNGKVTIDNAEVMITDLQADNGVVHVIDAILSPPTTVVDRVNASPNHQILATLLNISGLDIILNSDTEVTLFAPDDDAITALGQDNIDALLSNPELLNTVLVYHLLNTGSVLSTDITDGLIAETPLNLDLLFNLVSGSVSVNQGPMVNAADITAENGVVHSLNGVLLPSTTGSTISSSPAFSTLAAALDVSGLIGAFTATDSRNTLFAPTDDAFEALPDGLLDELLMDPNGELAKILTTHALDSRVFSNSLSDGQIETTLSGEDVTITIDNGTVFINNAMVIQTDFFTGNGIIHVIDAVIQDPVSNTVVDIIVESPDHSVLEQAVKEAGLVETLNGEGPFTVFAPTDEAFASLPDGLLETLLADPSGDLTTILTYHVVGSEILSGDLSNGDTAPTLQGESIVVTIDTDGIFINEAKVQTADITASNGIVHDLEGILLPVAYTNTEELEENAVSINPSLVSDYFSILMDKGILSNPSLYIFDNTGKIVHSQSNISENQQININTFSPGMYFITITDGVKAITKKITKL